MSFPIFTLFKIQPNNICTLCFIDNKCEGLRRKSVMDMLWQAIASPTLYSLVCNMFLQQCKLCYSDSVAYHSLKSVRSRYAVLFNNLCYYFTWKRGLGVILTHCRDIFVALTPLFIVCLLQHLVYIICKNLYYCFEFHQHEKLLTTLAIHQWRKTQKAAQKHSNSFMPSENREAI